MSAEDIPQPAQSLVSPTSNNLPLSTDTPPDAGEFPTDNNLPSGAGSAHPFQTNHLRDIFERANRIASTASLDELLNQMLDLMIYAAGGSNGTLYLHDPQAHELVFSVIRGSADDQELMGTRIREDKGIVGAVFAGKQPVVIEDLANDPRWFREIHPQLTARLHNVITLPMLVQGRAIGAIQIFNFLRVDLELLQLLAARMTSEVDKAILLQKSHRTTDRLNLLVEVIGDMSSTLDRDHLLNLLTGSASRLVEAQNSSVFLVDSTHEDGAQWLSHSSLPGVHETGFRSVNEATSSSSRFQAGSTISVPMRSRPITLGKDRHGMDARTIGNLISMNKKNGVFDAEDSHMLDVLAVQAGTMLHISTLVSQATDLFYDFLAALANTIDGKEIYTRGHSTRVSQYAVEIGRQIGLKEEALADIRTGGLLHDIGYISVPDYILSKPGTLSEQEFEEIKKHPGKGLKILEGIHQLRSILPAVMEHHERLDGSGYPLGLYGDQISLMGRIIAVADVFDALTTDRPYRKAMLLGDVLDFFEQNKNQRFDANCVEALALMCTQQNRKIYTE